MKFLRKHKKSKITLIVLGCLLLFTVIACRQTEKDAYVPPLEVRADLSSLDPTGDFTADDYRLIFYQTGLAKPAVDDIWAAEQDPLAVLKSYQDSFYAGTDYQCFPISTEIPLASLVTGEERFVNADGRVIRGFEFAPLHKGDILITRSTHTLFWRHGHAGLLTDPQNGFVMEAPMIGRDSDYYKLSNWQTRPAFILLRLKDIDEEQLDELIGWSEDNLLGLPWQPYAGMFNKYGDKKWQSTQCAYLIWQAFYHGGYDLAKGGVIVTPRDFVHSPLVEVVQIYGVDPANPWP